MYQLGILGLCLFLFAMFVAAPIFLASSLTRNPRTARAADIGLIVAACGLTLFGVGMTAFGWWGWLLAALGASGVVHTAYALRRRRALPHRLWTPGE